MKRRAVIPPEAMALKNELKQAAIAANREMFVGVSVHEQGIILCPVRCDLLDQYLKTDPEMTTYAHSDNIMLLGLRKDIETLFRRILARTSEEKYEFNEDLYMKFLSSHDKRAMASVRHYIQDGPGLKRIHQQFFSLRKHIAPVKPKNTRKPSSKAALTADDKRRSKLTNHVSKFLNSMAEQPSTVLNVSNYPDKLVSGKYSPNPKTNANIQGLALVSSKYEGAKNALDQLHKDGILDDRSYKNKLAEISSFPR